MAEHTLTDPSHNPRARGHQEDRVNIRAILVFTVALTAVVLVILGVLATIMNRFAGRDEQIARQPALFDDTSGLYPGPRLQDSPGRDMDAMRAETSRRLTHYGWVDRRDRIAHIPIDRAIEVTLQRGLPTRDDPEPSGGGDE